MKYAVIKKKGAVTIPQGFYAAALSAGLKKKNKLDVALLYSPRQTSAAAVFTKNRIQAWPVIIGQELIEQNSIHAVMVNSGNANCSNGRANKKKTHAYCQAVATTLGIEETAVFPSSTGVIGRDFPSGKIMKQIIPLAQRLSRTEGHRAAQAIMTTDTRTKEAYVSFSIGSKRVKLAAMAKGSGMIHPRMGTMLVFITSDVAISRKLLMNALHTVNKDVFSRMSVDNDTSTNDTVLILANGAAKNTMIRKKTRAYYSFLSALDALARYMRTEIVRDGEGVTKVCTIHVCGALTESDADRAARAVANSMLFKTALHGGDPNWGRIIAALGATPGLHFNPDKGAIAFNGITIFNKGKSHNQNLTRVVRILKKKEITLTIHLGSGKKEADFVTADLSREYIAINADYTT